MSVIPGGYTGKPAGGGGLLDSDFKNLGVTNFPLTAGAVNQILTSKTLPIGTWLIEAQIIIAGATSGGEIEAWVSGGSVSNNGYTAASAHASAAAGNTVLLTVTALLVLTSAAPMVLDCEPPSGMTGSLVARAQGINTTNYVTFLTCMRLL